MNSIAQYTQTAPISNGNDSSSIGFDLDRGEPSATRQTLLIVDGASDTIELFKTVVRRAGLDNFGTSDGYAALRKFGQARPDIVLHDLMMPTIPELILTPTAVGYQLDAGHTGSQATPQHTNSAGGDGSDAS